MQAIEAGREQAESGIDRGRREPLSASGLDEAIHIRDRGLRQGAVDHGLAWLRHTEAELFHDRDDRIHGPLSIVTGLPEAQVTQDLGLAGGVSERKLWQVTSIE